MPSDNELIAKSGMFDPAWYLGRYPGVALRRDDPVTSYLRSGWRVGRRPNPEFDPDYYLSAYNDARKIGPPLLHYLKYGKGEGRAYSVAHAKELVACADAAWRARNTGSGSLTKTPRAGTTISYCIPLMNRLSDIQETLAVNIEENRVHSDRVEFLVAVFGNRDGSADWVEETFSDEIASGYLRVHRLKELDGWHFGKAKNAFRPLIQGQVYSSLDGDNFVTCEETEQLLEIHAQHGSVFLMHHFSGQWGDGTCGRVSLPSALYRAVGYDERLLPRQFDEIDLILSTMRHFPFVPLLCFDPDRNALTLSKLTDRFRCEDGIVNRFIGVERTRHVCPKNPKGEGYAQSDPVLDAMGLFNASSSFLKNAKSSANRATYEANALKARMKLVDNSEAHALVPLLFETDHDRATPTTAGERVPLFLCCKNDDAFLPDLLDHYRARGVGPFFIVDDHSDRPVSEWVKDSDVFVFRPKVGKFLTAKVLWLSALVKAHIPEGNWVLTIDADEFVELPLGIKSFAELAQKTDLEQRTLVPGLMLDMLPSPGTPTDRLEGMDRHVYGHICNVEDDVSQEYAGHHSVSWGFGPHCRLSWRVDARYHAFGTFDSLRKIPFFRTEPGRHLNQGLHTLHYSDGRQQPDHGIWRSQHILAVRHYKLAKMLAQAHRSNSADTSAGYHARSAQNIRRISDLPPEIMRDRLACLPSAPYADAAAVVG